MIPNSAPELNDGASPARSRSDLAPRVIAALILAPLAIAAAYLGGWWFAVFWGAAAIGIFWEWCGVTGVRHDLSITLLGATAIVIAVALLAGGRSASALLVCALGAMGVGVFAPADRRLLIGCGLIYAAAAAVAPILVRADPQFGFIAIVFLFAVVWATDVAGYFVGRAVGGPRLVPRISPKKTWSGAIGGVAAAIVIGMAVVHIAGLATNSVSLGLVAAGLAVASQAGDLFESALKRRFGVKDSSQLIPGHGGLMDRLDGFLVAAVVGALLGWLRADMDVARGLMVW